MILHTSLVSLRDARTRNLRDADAPRSRDGWSTRDDRHDDRVALAEARVDVHWMRLNVFRSLCNDIRYIEIKYIYNIVVTMISVRCSTNHGHWTAARHQKLVRVANVVDHFRLSNGEILKIQP